MEKDACERHGVWRSPIYTMCISPTLAIIDPDWESAIPTILVSISYLMSYVFQCMLHHLSIHHFCRAVSYQTHTCVRLSEAEFSGCPGILHMVKYLKNRTSSIVMNVAQCCTTHFLSRNMLVAMYGAMICYDLFNGCNFGKHTCQVQAAQPMFHLIEKFACFKRPLFFEHLHRP